jgi:hypothetical protein
VILRVPCVLRGGEFSVADISSPQSSLASPSSSDSFLGARGFIQEIGMTQVLE